MSTTKHEVEEDLLKPLWIATVIATRPCLVYWVTFVVMIIMAAIDSAVFELNLEGHERTWLVEADDYSVAYDAWTLGTEASGATTDENSTAADPQTEQAGLWNAFMMFELKNYDSDDNNWILTPDTLSTIVEYEEMITTDETWTEYFCYVNEFALAVTGEYECDYFSLAQIVCDNFTCDDPDSFTTEEVIDFVWNFRKDAGFDQALVDSSFNPTFLENNKTRYYRSFLYSGGPIPTDFMYDDNGTLIGKTSDYVNLEDDYDKQEDIYNEDFAFDVWDDITVKHDAQLSKSGVRIALLIYSAWIDYIWEEFNQSVLFIFLAMAAVVSWMTFHLQSCCLSCLGLVGILFSFPFAYFIYYYIYGITHFDFLSALIIFVLLGVGADDVFVFTGNVECFLCVFFFLFILFILLYCFRFVFFTCHAVSLSKSKKKKTARREKRKKPNTKRVKKQK